MLIFSRLSVFVFLGIVFLFVGGATDDQAQGVSLDAGACRGMVCVYEVGDPIQVVFFALDIHTSPVSGGPANYSTFRDRGCYY